MAGIASNSLVFSGRQYALLFFALVRNMLLARILGQSDFNYWVLFQLFLIYIDLTHLGLRQAASREIPILKGEGRSEESLLFGKTVLGGTILLSIAAAIILLGFALLIRSNVFSFEGYENSILANGLFIASLLVISEQIYRYFLTILRTRHEFIKSSVIEVTYEIVRTGIICALAYEYSAIGGVSGYVFSVTGVALLLLILEGFPKPTFNARLIRAALVIGIPLFFASLSNILVISIDRIIATTILTPDELSIYGFAVPLALLPVFAIQSLRDVLFPSFGELSSSIAADQKFGTLYIKALRISGIVAPVMSVTMLVFIEPAILIFVPKFTDSIDILFYLVGATTVLGLGAIPNSVLLVLRKQWSAFWISVLASVVLILLVMVIHYTTDTRVSALIFAVWCSFILYTTTSIWFSIRPLLSVRQLKPSAFFGNLIKAVVPFIAGLLLVYHIRTSYSLEWGMQYVAQIAIFGVVSSWIIYSNRDLIPELLNVVKRLLPGARA